MAQKIAIVKGPENYELAMALMLGSRKLKRVDFELEGGGHIRARLTSIKAIGSDLNLEIWSIEGCAERGSFVGSFKAHYSTTEIGRQAEEMYVELI